MPPSTTDISRCSTGQLRALLALVLDRRGAYGALLARARDLHAVRRLLDEAAGTSGQGSSLLPAVCERGASLKALDGARSRAKVLLDHAPSEAHREAATLVYHAATAAALARHGINLSSIPPETRLSLYDDLASALGDDPLADVFREAADYIGGAGGA